MDKKKLIIIEIIALFVIVGGIALFVNKGQEKKVEPIENDFSVTRIQENKPKEVEK